MRIFSQSPPLSPEPMVTVTAAQMAMRNRCTTSS